MANVLEQVAGNADIIKNVVGKAGHPQIVMGLAFLGTIALFAGGYIMVNEVSKRKESKATAVIEEPIPIDAAIDVDIDSKDITEEK